MQSRLNIRLKGDVMPFLKTLSGGGGSCKQIDDYLSFGHRSAEDHEERIEKYLAGDKSASRSMAFGHSPGLPDTPYGWHKVMDATRKRFGKDKPPEWFEKKENQIQISSGETTINGFCHLTPGTALQHRRLASSPRSGVRGYGLPIGAGSGSGPCTTTTQAASCTPI